MLSLKFILRSYLRCSYSININVNNIKGIHSWESYTNQTKRFNSKYTTFKDEESSIIFDVEEERLKKQIDKNVTIGSSTNDLKLFRNKQGALSIEELVELVKTNNAKNVSVIKLSPELNYVDFIVTLTGTSRRHLVGLAELIRKEFKEKMNNSESSPKIEGANTDWIAIDLGNIAIHLMLNSIRKVYDLESLWALGAKYDTILNANDDEAIQLLKQHSINLDDLLPALEKNAT